jgi:mannose-6-phosphate isomerase-like protein (cupin superfamily)
VARLEQPTAADEGQGELIVDPVLRQRYRFEPLSDDDGDFLRIHTWVQPGGGVTPHVHPTMDERFTVHEGEAEFLSGRRWTAAGPGESAHVPPGTRHSYRNRSNEVAYVVCDARPPETLQDFLQDAATLNRSGVLTRHALPKTPGAVLQAMVLAQHYGDMVELHFPPMPPRPLQRLIVPPLARLGARRGYTAGPVTPRR